VGDRWCGREGATPAPTGEGRERLFNFPVAWVGDSMDGVVAYWREDRVTPPVQGWCVVAWFEDDGGGLF